MITPTDIHESLFRFWGLTNGIDSLVPGGLWIAGTVPANAVAPYATMTVTEDSVETLSNKTLRKFGVELTLWSDGAAKASGEITSLIADRFSHKNIGTMRITGGKLLLFFPGSSELQMDPLPRAANDVTIGRVRRIITTEERN